MAATLAPTILVNAVALGPFPTKVGLMDTQREG